MKTLNRIFSIGTALVIAFTLFTAAQDNQPSQKEVASKVDVDKAKEKFLEAKCNTCHAFSALGIEAKNKSANNKAPDCSKIETDKDKDFFMKYLKKEETLNNKKHPVAFKGNDEDLEAILLLILSHNEPANEENNKEQ